jgi:hypothetical protein
MYTILADLKGYYLNINTLHLFKWVNLLYHLAQLLQYFGPVSWFDWFSNHFVVASAE